MDVNLVKEQIIGHLLDQGFASYSERFLEFQFVVAEMYGGSYCATAFMVPDDNVICINPGFFELQNPNDKKEQKESLDKVSVLIRHELLHFLLKHERNFIKYLKKKYPNSWGRNYANPTMHRIANFAMDYDISNQGYTDEDKQIIRTLTLNGEFVGGLITEEQVRNDRTSIWFDDGTKEYFSGSQFNGWENKTMEEMWQMLADAHNIYTKKNPADFGNKNAPEPTTPAVDDKKDAAYKAMFDKIITKFGNGKASIAELQELYGRLMAGDDIDVDNWSFKYSEGLKGLK